jgi:isopentenyl diphosphate isomerase/L-lactate dehydrogenase-like FMN-dependent dehydrogenase
MVLSTAATHSVEEVAATGAPRWFQLYWPNDREICASFVERAEAAGYGAIVVTLDTLALGWRPRDLRHGYLPFLNGEGCGVYFSDPVFLASLATSPAEDPLTAAATMLARFPHLGLRWEDFDWLRARTTLPLLVKGILTAEDAALAFEHGMDGLIVSNHGGRQVDGAVAALDALVDVRDAHPDAVVLMDGGIRTAADVLKAIALGADAVLLGRPYPYALAVGGHRGVEELIQNLMAEIDLTLALLGSPSVRELDRSWLSRV